MQRPLTSWKEIATHFNKSVRTVQRWERMFALPVRRPDARDRGIVMAFPVELDCWMRKHLLPRPTNGDSGQAENRYSHSEATTLYSASLSDFRRVRLQSSQLLQMTQGLLTEMQSRVHRLRIILGHSEDIYKRLGSENLRAANQAVPHQGGPA